MFNFNIVWRKWYAALRFWKIRFADGSVAYASRPNRRRRTQWQVGCGQ